MVAALVAEVKKSMSKGLRFVRTLSPPVAVDSGHTRGIGWERPTPSRTMTTLTNVQIFERIIEAFNRDGVEGLLPYYTDDVEVYDPDLPPGTYRGPAAVSRVIEMLMSGFEDVEIRNFRLLPAGNRVVALLHTRGRGE